MIRKDWYIDALWLGLFLVAALILYTVGLGDLPLRDWDEGTVAQVAKEIALAPPGSLTWLHPTLYGQPYLNKPPLVHWLIAIAFRLGGINEWTARLPGALITALSVPLIYSVANELFRRRLPAVLTAAVYLTLLPVARHGRLAMLDGALLFFLLIIVWSLLRSRRDARFALGIGIGLGLICMTKGVMVGLLLGSIAIAFLVWDTPRLLSVPHLWGGLFLGLAPVAAWYVLQWQHYGLEFLRTNIGDQSFERIGSSVEGNSGPPWYYLLEFIELTFPWLLFVPVSLRMAWENRNLSWARLTLVWSGIYFLAISLMATKLPWYILPLYPAIALMLGIRLAQFWNQGRPAAVKYTLQPYSKLWVATFLFFAGVSGSSAAYLYLVVPERSLYLAAILGTLSATMLFAAILTARQNSQAISIIVWGTYLALLLLMLSPHWVWELAETYPVKPVANLIRERSPAQQTIFTSYPNHRPSLNFYSDRVVVPASLTQLQTIWQQRPNPHLLLDEKALKYLKIGAENQLGSAEGWILVGKK